MKKVSSWKELTLREKIGQTVVCLCETEKHIEMCGGIKEFCERYPVGGVYNNGGIVKGLMVDSVDNFVEVVGEYNNYLRVPLITCADEGDVIQKEKIDFPPQMAVGATNDEEVAYMSGEFRAEDFKKTGVHWGFWPVCDLNISKHSPVTDVRSVSDNWELTTKIVKQELKAMKDRGVISTLKHYPGPPYDECIDPHLAPTDNETPIEYWRDTYGKMYKELIAAGAPAIMTAHVNLVNYQTEKIDGVYPPATMSYELTTKLLREELGFYGVTITDALVMGGFCGAKSVENCILSFLSGNDVLLWPTYEYIAEMEKRILSGEIDEKLLDAAVERIWNLKKEYGIIDGKVFDSNENAEFFESRVKAASEKSLTIFNNKILPVNKENIKNVCVIGVTPDDGLYEKLTVLKDEFEKYGCTVTMKRNIWTDELEEETKNTDLVVFALCRVTHQPIGPIDFWGNEASSIWASNCSDRTKTVVASFGSPYLYKYYKNSDMTYVNAYSYSRYAIEAFVKAVFGDCGFDGVSSVEI